MIRKKKVKRLKLSVFKTTSKKEVIALLEDEVFNQELFKKHVLETAVINEVDVSVALDIVKCYLIDVTVEMLSKDRKKPLTIYLAGLMKIEIKTRKDKLNGIHY